MERIAAERRVCGDDDAQRAPHTREFLDRDGVGERVQPGTALFLGKRDAEQAHLAQLGDDVGREAALRLVHVDVALDLAREEVTDRSAQEFVLWGEVKVHDLSG